jgi:hypothetical protein
VPTVNWKILGDRAVLDATKKLVGAAREHGDSLKETGEESRKLDRYAKDLIKRTQEQTSAAQKYAQSQRDVAQILNTNRHITKEMADKELRRLKEQYLGVGAASKKAAADQAESIAKARTLIRGLETQEHRYKQAALEVQKLRRAGMLTDQQAIEAVRKLQHEMLGGAEAERQAAKERERAAAIGNALLTDQERNQRKYNAAVLDAVGLRNKEMLSASQFAEHEARLRHELLGGADAEKLAARAKIENAKASDIAAAATRREEAAAAALAQRNERSQKVARNRSVAEGYARKSREEAEQNRLRAEAASLLRSLSTAQDDYNQKLLTYRRLQRAGAITDQQAVHLVRQARVELKAAGQAQNAAFGPRALTSLQAWVGGMASIASVVSAVKYDMQEADRMAEARAQAQRTAASAERELRVSISTFSEPERRRVMSAAESAASDFNLDHKLVYDSMRTSINASGDIESGIKNARSAMEVTGNMPGAESFGASVGDMRDSIGTESADEALGFLLRSAGRARIESVTAMGKNLPRALRYARNQGQDAKEAAAVFVAINQGAVDPTGDITRSGTIQYLKQSRKFFDEKVAAGAFKALEVDDIGEQVAIFQRDKTLRDAFLKDATFESGAVGAVRGLLSGEDVKVNQSYRDTRLDLNTDLAKVGRDARKFIGDSPLQEGDLARRTINTLAESTAVRGAQLLGDKEETELVDSVYRAYREAKQPSLPGARALPFLERPVLGGAFRVAYGADVTPAEGASFAQGAVRDLEYLQGEGAKLGPEFESLKRAAESLERSAGILAQQSSNTAQAERSRAPVSSRQE